MAGLQIFTVLFILNVIFCIQEEFHNFFKSEKNVFLGFCGSGVCGLLRNSESHRDQGSGDEEREMHSEAIQEGEGLEE